VVRPSYDRYEFRIDGIRMPVSVIVPNAPAPGKPWVFRPDFVTRDAAVDLALLAKGFHVVTGPVPTDTDGPVLQQWNAVYKHLTDAGLSKTPVMEGAGGRPARRTPGRSRTPDKVSCVYAENPILRSHMTKAQPLDRLAARHEGRRARPARLVAASTHGSTARRASSRSGTGTRRAGHGDRRGRQGHYPTAPKDVEAGRRLHPRRQKAKEVEPKPLPPAPQARSHRKLPLFCTPVAQRTRNSARPGRELVGLSARRSPGRSPVHCQESAPYGVQADRR